VPTASAITIREALDLLDGPFVELANGISENLYALWLGSGISLSRMPGLIEIATAVLDHLQRRVEVANAACAYRNSLEAILSLVGLPDVLGSHAVEFVEPHRRAARILRPRFDTRPSKPMSQAARNRSGPMAPISNGLMNIPSGRPRRSRSRLVLRIDSGDPREASGPVVSAAGD
jgi:hypothetical protein